MTPTPNDVVCITIRRGESNCDIHDAYIWQSQPDYPHNSSTLYTGIVNDGEKQSLIDFELPETLILDQIEIVSATLNLRTRGQIGFDVTIYPVNTSWSESTVTWNSFDDHFDDDISALWSVSGEQVSFDLTEIFTAWSNGRDKYGVVLISDPLPTSANRSVSTYTDYYSSEASGNRPNLVLCYRPANTPVPTYTVTPFPTSTPPPSFTPTPQPPTPTPPPSPTPSPFPCLGNPSLEFDPDEWIAVSSGQTAVSTGDLCNTGGPGGDCATDVHFWWDETSCGFVDSVQFSGDFALMMGGDCRDLTVTATMAGLWASQPPGTEATAWLYAEPMNRPGHVAHVRLTITRTSSSR